MRGSAFLASGLRRSRAAKRKTSGALTRGSQRRGARCRCLQHGEGVEVGSRVRCPAKEAQPNSISTPAAST